MISLDESQVFRKKLPPEKGKVILIRNLLGKRHELDLVIAR